MIDTHCHLLPAVDDGPATMDSSLAMAEALLSAGVRTVVCTPHFSRRFPVPRAAAEAQLERLREHLERRGIPLRLELAAELSPVAAIDEPDEALHERGLGPSHLLVELEAATPARTLPIIVDRVRRLGRTVVFAHPERCRAVRADPGILAAARRDGALAQVVAPSLVGRWGTEAAEFAWDLLTAGEADLLASDAHTARHAAGRLAAALSEVRERLGPAVPAELMGSRPAQILAAGGTA